MRLSEWDAWPESFLGIAREDAPRSAETRRNGSVSSANAGWKAFMSICKTVKAIYLQSNYYLQSNVSQG